MYNKIQKFQEFKENAINEGLIDKAKQFGRMLIDKLGSVYNVLKEWITPKKITSGPKKGSMSIKYIDTSGDVLSEVDKAYAGTEFARIGRLKPTAIKENLTIEEEFKLNEAHTWREYPTDNTNFDAPENVDAKELKYFIKLQYKNTFRNSKNKSKPSFFFGAPGIGKTQIVAQVAKELGIKLIVFEVQNMEPSDFKGLGTPATYLDDETLAKRGVKNKDSLVYLRDESLFPNEETSETGGIIFMDEFPNADEDVIKKLNLFIQNGTIDSSYQLPQNWIIVGAGNRPGDQDDIYDFKDNIPAADRWKFFHFTPKPSDWIDWARENNEKYKKGEKIQTIVKGKLGSKKKEVEEKERTYILPEILDLVEVFSEIDSNEAKLFYNLDADVNSMSYASPRSWENFSIDIAEACAIEDIDIDEWYRLPSNIISKLAKSHVGTEARNILMSYIDVRKYFTMDAIIKVFENPKSAPFIKEIKKDASKITPLINIMLPAFKKYTNGNEDKIIDAYINILNYLLKYEAGEPLAFAINTFQNEFPDVLNLFAKTGEDLETPKYQKLKNAIQDINKEIKKINSK